MSNLTAEQVRSQPLKGKRRQQNKKTGDIYALKAKARKSTTAEEGEICPHCHRKMHPEAECWALHSENAPDWFKNKYEKKVAIAQYVFSFGH